MSLIIAIPRERRPSERRVALDPSRVERLIQEGMQVRIEAECGHTASFHDDDYHDVTVCDNFAELVSVADVVVKVVCPTVEEIALLPPHSVLVCIISAFQHRDEIAALRDRRITVLAMDHLPRTTRAQPMDALSSQATVAGYKAALLAAELSPRLFPMLTTAAGTIRPSRVLVIGAGVAGLQAIATARRLGAQVEAYDIRRAAKEQIESLGARMVDTGVEVEGAGGYARALRKDEKQKQHDVLAEHLAKAHVVICAASIPSRQAPKIITEDMVDGMLPESVIVDLAASTGGNCELTRIGEHYYHHETLIVGPLNLPSHGAVHASEMYARNVHNMLKLVIRDNDVVLDPQDDIVARCIVCHDGDINHGPTAGRLEVEHVSFGGAVHTATDLAEESAGWLDDAATVQADHAGETASPGIQEDSVMSVNSSVEQTAAEVAVEQNPVQSLNEALTADASVTVGDELTDLDNLVDTDAVAQLRMLDGLDSEPVSESTEPLMSDDLTRIDGVGPALQERLFAFGFRRWQQLAALDDQEVEKLSVQLELGDEVKEQDWVGQAQQLMEAER